MSPERTFAPHHHVQWPQKSVLYLNLQLFCLGVAPVTSVSKKFF